MNRLFSIFWSLLNVRLFMVEREHKCPFVRWLKSNITTPTVYLFIPFKPMRAVIRRLNVGNYPSCSALLTPVLGDTFTCWDSCGVWLCNIQGGKKKKTITDIKLRCLGINELTEPEEQLSSSPTPYSTTSLMNTAMAFRINDMKRCMWMKFLVQWSFLNTNIQHTWIQIRTRKQLTHIR